MEIVAFFWFSVSLQMKKFCCFVLFLYDLLFVLRVIGCIHLFVMAAARTTILSSEQACSTWMQALQVANVLLLVLAKIVAVVVAGNGGMVVVVCLLLLIISNCYCSACIWYFCIWALRVCKSASVILCIWLPRAPDFYILHHTIFKLN